METRGACLLTNEPGHSHDTSHPVSTGERLETLLPGVQGPIPAGHGRPRRSELYQGRDRWKPDLSMVVQNGSMRQLWRQHRRRAEVDMRQLSPRVQGSNN